MVRWNSWRELSLVFNLVETPIPTNMQFKFESSVEVLRERLSQLEGDGSKSLESPSRPKSILTIFTTHVVNIPYYLEW